MKNYIHLKEADVIQVGDEGWDSDSESYRAVVEKLDDGVVTKSEELLKSFRRPVPHSGDVQFLMCVSIMVPVIVNCDGQTQEEIEDEAGQLAVEKVMANPREYVHFENIDWGACKVDEIQPEPKRKSLLQRMNEQRATLGLPPIGADNPKNPGQPLSEPQKKNIYDDEGNPIFKKSVVPRYRPFVEGDVIEEGDQWRWKKERTEWLEARSIDIGTEIKEDFDCFRKLIK